MTDSVSELGRGLHEFSLVTHEVAEFQPSCPLVHSETEFCHAVNSLFLCVNFLTLPLVCYD